jgi:hypothetical protein
MEAISAFRVVSSADMVLISVSRSARVGSAMAVGGGTLQNGIRADSRGFTGACVAVAQAWCAWLVWIRRGHTAWHMR